MEILYLISADADKPDARWGPNPHANSFGFQQLQPQATHIYSYYLRGSQAVEKQAQFYAD